MRLHIQHLEQQLSELSEQLMASSSIQRRNQIEANIRACRMALGYYREALEIETNLGKAGETP